MKRPRKNMKLISAREAAELLEYKSSRTVRRLQENGTLKGYRRGLSTRAAWMFSEQEVLALREKTIVAV